MFLEYLSCFISISQYLLNALRLNKTLKVRSMSSFTMESIRPMVEVVVLVVESSEACEIRHKYIQVPTHDYIHRVSLNWQFFFDDIDIDNFF